MSELNTAMKSLATTMAVIQYDRDDNPVIL